MENINVEQTRILLSRNNVPTYLYCIGGLGAGECIGLAQREKEWITYFSEKGAARSIREFVTESAACHDLISRIESLAKDYGIVLSLNGEI